MLLSVRLLAEILLLVVVLLCFHVMQAVQLSMSDTVLALQTKEIVSPIKLYHTSNLSVSFKWNILTCEVYLDKVHKF